MNKKIPMYKRVGAMFLCLALLCGVIVGSGVLPKASLSVQADAADVESFEVDFADLAALVGNEKWNASNRYRPVQADTAIQNWINTRFGLYLCREAGAYKPYSFLGQSSFATGAEWQNSDGWSGEYWWEITKDGGLHSYCGKVGGQMLRKSQTLAVKHSDGTFAELSNFEANVVFSKAGNTALGSVYLSFHEAEPGRMNTNTNNGENTCNGTVALVGNAFTTWVAGDPNSVANATYGKRDKDGVIIGSLSGKDDRTLDEQFAADLDANADYNLYVKVVGKKMTMTVSKVSDNSVVYTKTVDIPEGVGYISVGTSNDDRVIKKIKITELDKNGDPVDFGSTKSFKWTTSGKTGYANGKHTYNTPDNTADDKDWYNFVGENAGKADTVSIINALNKNFDVYYNCEGTYAQMQAGDKAAYEGQTGNYGWFRGVYEDVWLQRPTASAGGNQNMRLITSLVPKVSGKALAYKNFDTTFNVRLDNDDASFVFGFRQATPGKFTNGYFNVNKEQGLVVVNKTGIVVSGGENIFSGQTSHVSMPGDMYDSDATATFATAIPKGPVTIRVKAVGDQVFVSVYNNSTTFYSNTVTVPYTKAGYLAYGVANRGSDMGAISLTHLDENGYTMPTNEMTDAEAAVFAEPWTLSFANLPGATFTGGKYTEAGQNYAAFTKFSTSEAHDTIAKKVDFFFNHEGAYRQVPAYGNTGDCGNWILFYNNWLQRTGSAGWGERLRQINSIVPKDDNGVQAQMKNLSASFEYRFEGGGDGAAVFGFRQKNPGKFVNGYNAPNQEQVLVAITRKSIAVAGGADITKERFYHYDQFANDDFGDVFTADLPQQIVVKVEAIGKDVTVNIYDYSNGSKLYSGTFTANYTKEGYMAFGVAATGGNVGTLKVNRLDNNGNAIDFTDDTYAVPTWPDGKTRFHADFKKLAKLAPSYVGGAYVPTANDTDIEAWMKARFGMYSVRETTASYYKELSYLGQPSSDFDEEAASKAAQWQIREAGGLYMNVSGTHGEMLRKSMSLTAKTAEGELAVLKNFEAEVVFNKGGAHPFGGLYLSFHETQPGNFGVDWKGNMAGAAVDGVIVGNGDASKYNTAAADGITAGNIKNNDNRGMRTKFSANLDNSADYKLWVKVVGTKLEWSVTKVGETTPVASGIETIEDTPAGYISVGARNRMIKSITYTELDKNGNVVDFGTASNTKVEKFFFSPVDLAEYKSSRYTATKFNADGSPILGPDGNPFAGYSYYGFAGKYGDNYHPDASNTISYIDSKMALYYDCEGNYYQMQPGVKLAYSGQTGNTGALDTLLYNEWLQKTGSYGGSQNFRMVNSMVPRNSVTGEELQFENFETSFTIRFESTKEHENSAILGFRQAVPGKFTKGYWNIVKEQAFVSVTRFGITIAGGDQIVSNMAKDPETGAGLHKSDEGDMYNEDQTYKFDEMLPQEIAIYVKVIGDKVTLKVTNKSGSATYYDNSAEPFTVGRTGSGYLAYGLGSRSMNIGAITLSRLDAEGEQISVNGSDSVPGCPWDTTTERFSETMNEQESVLEGLYNFYYSAMVGGTPVTAAESLSDHWELADGILMRANDLSGNATANVALISPKDMKLKNFDASFKLDIDEKQEGTFWVTARQSDQSKVGKIVATPGSADYLNSQVAVGFAVGGDVIIATDANNVVTIPGNAIGTPSGTYTLRVRLYGNMVEVYVNGNLRVARSLANAATGEGYFTFGYSGAALGIAGVDITKLNDQGAAVDLTSEYVSVENPTAPIVVGVGEAFSTVTAQLPTSLKVNKAAGGQDDMNVYWDPNSIDLSVEGDYTLVGYLDGTNGIRAAATVYVGAFDREITTQYDFNDESQLNDFTSWYLPTTEGGKNQPAIKVEGTDDDNWVISGGRLTYKQNSMFLTGEQLKYGVELNGTVWKHDAVWSGYAANFGIAVLNTRKFENFILDVDFKQNTRWNLVGFGAQDPNDANSVFATHINGGYSFHIESGGTTGSGRLWGYDPTSDASKYIKTQTMEYDWDATPTHHMRIVVSDGMAYMFLNDNETPLSVELPDTYKAGYIYFGLNSAGAAFDNLRITDLDKKQINITDVITPEPAMQTIDRKLGEALAMGAGGLLTVADENGYEYQLPYDMKSDTYRSNKEGVHEFSAVFKPFHGMTVASSVQYTAAVDNKINGDFDTETSVKYYFDHPNDFLDFYSQYSEPKTVVIPSLANGQQTYYSAYDGKLVDIDANERWTVKDGKAVNNYTANPGGYAEYRRAIGVSSLVLKDLNLMNFRLEMDYKQGSNFWYSYLRLGVQDPNVFYGSVNWDNKGSFEEWVASGTSNSGIKYADGVDGGVWVHMEQEGYFNIHGALDGVTHQRYTSDMSSDFIKTYDKKIEHHMVVEVIDGFLTLKVDNSDAYYCSISPEVWGGLIGIAGSGNGGTFDNLKITALDYSGNVVPFDQAEKGWAPEPIPDEYEGWQPAKNEWYFEWGKEYEHDIKNNVK